MDTKRGRPKVSEFVEITIAYKVMQYCNRYNETPYKAWFRLIKHRAFKSLMEDHYKNTSHPGHWVNKLTENKDSQRKFYSKHIKSFIIEYRLASGLGSLQDQLNKLRK